MINRFSIQGGHPIKKLGELAEFLDHKRRPITAKDRTEGPYPYFGANGQQDTVGGYIFDEPLILVAEDGGHFDDPDRGIAYRIEGKSWVNNHAHVLRPKPGVDLSYLCRALENYDVRPYISGTTRAKLTKAQAEKIEIPIPPLSEQQRIAAVLDQADAYRRLRSHSLARLANLGQAVFIKRFVNSGAMAKKRIGDFAFVKGGKRLPKKTDYSPVPTGHPYIRVSNLSDGLIQTDRIKFISEATHKEVAKYIVRTDDVVISIAGTIGVVAPVRADLEGANLTENAAKITPRPGFDFDPDYLTWALQTPELRHAIRASTGQVTIGKLALFRIEDLEIPFPDIAVQKAFADEIERIAETRELFMRAASKAHSLFKSLQNRAFLGSADA